MVIGDNDGKSQLLSPLYNVQSRDPVVAGKYGAHPVGYGRVHYPVVYAVALACPVGHVIVRRTAAFRNGLHEYAPGHASVNVVVLHHPYFSVIPYVAAYYLRQYGHVLHSVRVMHILEAAMQKPLYVRVLRYVPVSYELGGYGRYAEFFRDGGEIGLFVCQKPFFHIITKI